MQMTIQIAIYKVRLAVLWIFAAGCWVVGFSINLLMPGVIQGISIGQIGGKPISEWQMALYALFYIVPFTIAVLCLTLEGSLNRWLNVVVRIVGGIVLILDLCIHAANLANGGREALAIWLTMLTGVVVSVIIVALAWRYPKQAQCYMKLRASTFRYERIL
jgi:hypothetical protein